MRGSAVEGLMPFGWITARSSPKEEARHNVMRQSRIKNFFPFYANQEVPRTIVRYRVFFKKVLHKREEKIQEKMKMT